MAPRGRGRWQSALALLGAVPGEARAPGRLMVLADEHSLVLSRQSIVRGPALIQFLNRGEDPHDLRLRRIGGSQRRCRCPRRRPDELAEAEVRLRTGTLPAVVLAAGASRARHAREAARAARALTRRLAASNKRPKARWKPPVSGIPLVDSIRWTLPDTALP